jgi:hypothetical protein
MPPNADQERFEAALDDQFADEAAVRAAVDDYFGLEGGVFTGSLFELLASTDPYAFTAQDMLALGALSEVVPPRVAYWLLGPEGQARSSVLLRRVPLDVDIWSDQAAAVLERGGALWDLWDLLRCGCWPHEDAANQMGTTRISKLLATKRPRLVPVWDGVVSATLPTGDSWHSMRLALRDDLRRECIEELTAAAPSQVSLLRRIDAVVWYRNRRQSPPDRGSAAAESLPAGVPVSPGESS